MERHSQVNIQIFAHPLARFTCDGCPALPIFFFRLGERGKGWTTVLLSGSIGFRLSLSCSAPWLPAEGIAGAFSVYPATLDRWLRADKTSFSAISEHCSGWEAPVNSYHVFFCTVKPFLCSLSCTATSSTGFICENMPAPSHCRALFPCILVQSHSLLCSFLYTNIINETNKIMIIQICNN